MLTPIVMVRGYPFDQKPVEGSIGRVRYQKGIAIVEGLKSVHKHRL